MSADAGSVNLDGLPAAPPPPGVTPNLINPPTIETAVITVSSIFMVIMLVFFSIRIYTKVNISGKLTADDYTCIISTILATLYYVLVVLAVTISPFGKHMWDTSAAELMENKFAIIGYMTNWSTGLIWPFIKVTFLLFYLQLFRPMRFIRYGCYLGMAVTVLFYFSYTVATLAFTTPRPGEPWIEQVQSHQQARSLDLAVPSASVSLVLDVYLLVLPIAGLEKLQLSRSRKLGVGLIFLTGIMACVASSMSIYFKVQLGKNPQDVTFQAMRVILTCFLEMSVGIIASCMPAMSKFYRSTAGVRGILSNLPFSRYTVGSSGSDGKNKSFDSSDNKQHFRKKKNQYTTFGATIDHLTPYDSDTVQMNTLVSRAEPQEIMDNRIHMQYSVTQNSNPNEKI